MNRENGQEYSLLIYTFVTPLSKRKFQTMVKPDCSTEELGVNIGFVQPGAINSDVLHKWAILVGN